MVGVPAALASQELHSIIVAYRSRPSHSSVLSRLTSSEHSLLSTAPTASPGARTYEW